MGQLHRFVMLNSSRALGYLDNEREKSPGTSTRSTFRENQRRTWFRVYRSEWPENIKTPTTFGNKERKVASLAGVRLGPT